MNQHDLTCVFQLVGEHGYKLVPFFVVFPVERDVN